MPPNTASIPGRKSKQGGRSQQTIKRLQMQRETTVRDKEGKVIFERFHNEEATGDGRIDPNRKWFGNTRVVGQKELDKMREVIDQEKQPNQFLLRSAKLPTALIRDVEPQQARLEDIEPFSQTFGPKAQRKKAKLSTVDPAEMLKIASEEAQNYRHDLDRQTQENMRIDAEAQKNAVDPRFTRGATNRIFSEIYKVIDSSDVICYVLDARDPDGTRSKHVENYLRLPENEHRHLIYVLNKVDLVPIWSTKSWIQKLSAVHPTIAYNAAARRPFGKAELISVMRQFSRIHKDRQNISIGFLGYPNVGKSSVINSLIGKDSCKVAPVPGETKVWQYVNLTKKIFLIDAPGVVFPGSGAKKAITDNQDYGDSLQHILKGVIRCEYIDFPEQILPTILEQVKKEHICRTYSLKAFNGPEDLMEQIARKSGRLLKGGEPDKRSVARRILEDYVRGHLPHFVAPYDDQEIQTYKDSVKAEREKWQHQTDSELIQFVNRQKFGKLGQEFKYLNDDPERAKFVTEEETSVEEQEEETEPESLESEKPAPENEDSASEIQSFGSEDIDDAFDETPKKAQQVHKEPKVKEPKSEALILRQKKRMKHLEGIQRATRIMQTKKQELIQAAASSLVDESLLKMIVHPRRDKKKKERQGGFDHQKTGKHFYDQKRAARISK